MGAGAAKKVAMVKAIRKWLKNGTCTVFWVMLRNGYGFRDDIDLIIFRIKQLRTFELSLCFFDLLHSIVSVDYPACAGQSEEAVMAGLSTVDQTYADAICVSVHCRLCLQRI